MTGATHRGGARDGAPAPAEHKGDTWQLKDAKARFSELLEMEAVNNKADAAAQAMPSLQAICVAVSFPKFLTN